MRRGIEAMLGIRRKTQNAIRSTQYALRRYWPLIKSLQTGLLLATGVAGYASAVRPSGHWLAILGLMGSLFLTISGSTVLNMALRPRHRRVHETHSAGARSRRARSACERRSSSVWTLSALGVGWALAMEPLYGCGCVRGAVGAIVYTIWLKRRTPYAIIIGGLAGGMPCLAGPARLRWGRSTWWA